MANPPPKGSVLATNEPARFTNNAQTWELAADVALSGSTSLRLVDNPTTQQLKYPRPPVYPRKKKHRRHHRPRLLLLLLKQTSKPRNTRPRCRQPLDTRRVLSNRQERSRPRPLPGPRLHGLV